MIPSEIQRGVATTIVSGNQQDGIDVSGANATGDVITNAFIGVGLTGLTALGNGRAGISFMGVAKNTVSKIVDAGNSTVDFELNGTTNTEIVGNYFGLAKDGVTRLASAGSGPGIELDSGCSDNTIGGLGTATIGGAGTAGRNFISGNDTNGIELNGAYDNQVINNYIGLDINGHVQGNRENGIYDSGHDNTIGGTAAGQGNVISGSFGSGVLLDNGAYYTTVVGNFIGTNADATGKADSNGTHTGNGVGVTIQGCSTQNYIGGTGADARNVISGNFQSGVVITNDGTNYNLVAGDYIGTDVDGALAMGNGGDGVLISDGANYNGVGLLADGPDDTSKLTLISGNGGFGIYLNNASHTTIRNCYIGTDVTSTQKIGNVHGGVSLAGGSSSNTIGGLQEGALNVISGNGDDHRANNGAFGIAIWGVTADENGIVPDTLNLIQQNNIGTDKSGTQPVGNDGDGVYILNQGGTGNTVGGPTANASNRISDNGGNGVDLGAGSSNNLIQNNLIGVNPDGTNNPALINGVNPIAEANGLANEPPINDEGAGNVFDGNEVQP